MAIVKITELPVATSPVASNDVTAVVQNGVTKQAAMSELGYLPSGANSVTQTFQDKLRQSVSVFDYMSPAQIADVQARTFQLDTIDSIEAALAASPIVYFPPGGYLVSRAIALTGNSLNGKHIFGAQNFNTEIRRLTTNSEVINGQTVTCVLFVGGLDHLVENFLVQGVLGTSDGVVVDCARTTLSNIWSQSVRRAYLAFQPYLCIFNRLWAKSASETGFDFSSAAGKTTLIFNNCTCENVGNAFILTNAYYSVMNSCAADYANYTTTGNPYGVGFGSRASENAVYQFNGAGDVVMNGCGSENSYGNGFVGCGVDSSASITVNNCTSFGIQSTYSPPGGLGAGWAVGCFQTNRGPASITVNGGRFNFTNTTAPVVADLVAFNYDQGAYGVRNTSMVTLNGIVTPDNLLNAFAGRGNFIKYCKNSVNYRNQYSRTITGSGTVITIPIVSQSSAVQRHVIQILGVSNAFNTSAAYGTQATIGFASLSSVLNISYWNDSNIASVAASGMNLNITLSNALVNPLLVIQVLSTDEKLVNVNNITIA